MQPLNNGLRALFVCIFITACGPPGPLFGIRRLSAIRVLLLYCIQVEKSFLNEGGCRDVTS